MTGFVVRSVEEMDFVKKNYASDTLILATNHRAAIYAQRQNYPVCLLDEGLIQDEHRRLNYAAYAGLLRFIDHVKDDETKHLFLESNFYDIRSLFIRCIKFIRVLEKIRLKNPLTEVHSIQKPGSLMEMVWKTYRQWSGEKITFRGLVNTGVSRGKKSRPLDLKGLLRHLLGRCVRFAAGQTLRRWRKNGEQVLVVSGSLGHLAGVVERVRRESRLNVVWCETAFNYEKWRACRKAGVVFTVLDPLTEIRNPFQGDTASLALLDVHEEDADYSEVIRHALSQIVRVGLLNTCFDPVTLKTFLKGMAVHAVLIDEDIAVRRVFAILAEKLGLDCYVISHGVPAFLIHDPKDGSPPFYNASGRILINSECEKKAYERILYDPRKTVLTGSPRYDRLARLKREAGVLNRPPGRRKRILYCGTILIPYDFEILTVTSAILGLWSISSAETTEQFTRDLFKVLRGRGCELRVKPHYSDRGAWQALLERTSGDTPYELVSHTEEIFRLILKSDVVVSTPSTLMHECLMLGKPVIVQCANPDFVVDYPETPQVAVVRDAEELEGALTRFLDSDKPAPLPDPYYTGRLDEKATDRAARCILTGANADSISGEFQSMGVRAAA